jgi:hypothetical protein
MDVSFGHHGALWHFDVSLGHPVRTRELEMSVRGDTEALVEDDQAGEEWRVERRDDEHKQYKPQKESTKVGTRSFTS